MITHILNTNSAFCKGVEKNLCKGHEEKFECINLEFPTDFFFVQKTSGKTTNKRINTIQFDVFLLCV